MSIIAEKKRRHLPGHQALAVREPVAPIDEAIAAAQAEAAHSNHYTEPYSAPLRQLISEPLGVAERLIHAEIADQLRSRDILIKPLNDRRSVRASCASPRRCPKTIGALSMCWALYWSDREECHVLENSGGGG